MPTDKENQGLELIERLRIYFRDQRAQMVSEVESVFTSIQQTLNTEENRISKLSLTNGKPSTTLEDTSNGPVVSGQVDPAIVKMLKEEAESKVNKKKRTQDCEEEPVQMELKGGGKAE